MMEDFTRFMRASYPVQVDRKELNVSTFASLRPGLKAQRKSQTIANTDDQSPLPIYISNRALAFCESNLNPAAGPCRLVST